MLKTTVIVCLLLIPCLSRSQELFPVGEPASTVPKNAAGIRIFDEGYQEQGLLRNVVALRLMYGITPRLTVYVTGDVSNYHEKTLPFDFITHNHFGGASTGTTNTPVAGVPYPYVFNSVDVYVKYRFLAVDGENMHFRMAAYGEASDVFVPSHEAEPDLLVHTSGVGGGIISTYLVHKFAASLTTGFILPFEYNGNSYDIYGGVYPTRIEYGNAAVYNLSLGYLLLPWKYKNYRQTNWNVYCEFFGKSYQGAQVWQKDGPYSYAETFKLPITTPILKAGHYMDMIPGLQCIINSTYRVEGSFAYHIINQSYNHLYPWYQFGAQRYLFFNKRKKDILN